MKAKFIILDGIDGCGSTTHVKLLKDWFKELKLKVKTTHEPTNSDIGKLIRKYLKSNLSFPELDSLLFAADRVKHVKEIENDLKNQVYVISDRYLESSICYQQSDGIDINWIKELNKFALKPDLYIILDIDPSIAIQRLVKDRDQLEKFEKLEFLVKVRNAFLKRAKELNYPVIDTTGSIEEVHEEIKKIIKPLLKK